MENTVFQAEVLAIREAAKDYIQIKQTDEKRYKSSLTLKQHY